MHNYNAQNSSSSVVIYIFRGPRKVGGPVLGFQHPSMGSPVNRFLGSPTSDLVGGGYYELT